MAEDEIAKHTKKIYKTWLNKDMPILHKIYEFLIEIVIIVFAVSISIWFHNRSEHAHEQAEVKDFLLGLKEDLTNDIREMESDRQSYYEQRALFTYLTSLKLAEPVNGDTLHKYWSKMLNTTEMNPNDGRFQGFKSSGKIGSIENKTLQNDIMDLYEEDIPSLLASTKMYITLKMKFFDLFFKNIKRVSDSVTNLNSFLKTDEVFMISTSLASPTDVIGRYGISIDEMKKIISEIDGEYK